MQQPRPGAVVLYDNGWNHNENGRPHVVVDVCPTRGVRLCPLTSTHVGSRRKEAPIPARAGGLRRDSWVAATDAYYTRNQLVWADPSHINRQIGRLTLGELNAVKVTALTQLARRKSKALVTV